MNRSEEKRKRGRPAGSIARGRNYRLSFSEDEYNRVDNLSKLTGRTKAEIFREAFKIYENLELSKLPYEFYEDFDEENW